jgi:hypothetical protein
VFPVEGGQVWSGDSPHLTLVQRPRRQLENSAAEVVSVIPVPEDESLVGESP